MFLKQVIVCSEYFLKYFYFQFDIFSNLVHKWCYIWYMNYQVIVFFLTSRYTPYQFVCIMAISNHLRCQGASYYTTVNKQCLNTIQSILIQWWNSQYLVSNSWKSSSLISSKLKSNYNNIYFILKVYTEFTAVAIS